jgi:hypothetical protein
VTEDELRDGADDVLQRRAEVPEIAQRQIAGQQLPRIRQVLVIVVACGGHQNGLVKAGDDRDGDARQMIARMGLDAHQGVTGCRAPPDMGPPNVRSYQPTISSIP